ncbi:hypothetical protein KAU33_06670, partial [Candidatus Dependentiae bacterium]|nr:hypothetical protein [Candidatus Dependentiae bacterium]
KYFIIITLLSLFNIITFSTSGTEMFGEEGKLYSASSLAMGHTSIIGYRGPETIYNNPANLADTTDLKFDLSYNMLLLSEHRSYPAYSFFDNLIGYQTYVSNQNVYPDFSFGISKGFKFGANTVGVGFAYLPVYSFNFDYLEEVRNENDPEPMKIANNIIERTGILGSYSLGFGYKFRKLFSVGLAFNMLSGTIDNTVAVRFTDDALATVPTDPGYTLNSTYELSGTSFTVGGNFYLKRFHFGISYKSGAEVGKTFTFMQDDTMLNDEDLTFKLPSSYGIAIQYLPRNGIWTKIILEYEHIAWSQFESSISDILDMGFTDDELAKYRMLGINVIENLDDIDYYKLGIEHIFPTGAIMRLGFYNKNSYISKNLKTVGFTAGTGFSVSDLLQINIGVDVAKRKYYTSDLFPDSLYSDFYGFMDPVEDRTSQDVVEEVESTIQFSLSFTF